MSEHGPDDPLLPDITEDERDIGWGDDATSSERERDPDDLDRFLRDVPPHHGD